MVRRSGEGSLPCAPVSQDARVEHQAATDVEVRDLSLADEVIDRPAGYSKDAGHGIGIDGVVEVAEFLMYCGVVHMGEYGSWGFTWSYEKFIFLESQPWAGNRGDWALGDTVIRFLAVSGWYSVCPGCTGAETISAVNDSFAYS